MTVLDTIYEYMFDLIELLFEYMPYFVWSLDPYGQNLGPLS